MIELSEATRRLANQVTLAAAVMVAGEIDNRKVERTALGIEESGKVLDRVNKRAQAHIVSWSSESRWKKAKNVAVPKLAAGRRQLGDMSKSVSLTLVETGTLLKAYRAYEKELITRQR